jgi:hypothetical protein
LFQIFPYSLMLLESLSLWCIQHQKNFPKDITGSEKKR